MKLLSFLLVAGAFSQTSFAAPCPYPTFTADKDVSITGDDVLIVTHPATIWDWQFSAKNGVDNAVEFARKKNIPVIYLQDSYDGNSNKYFWNDCRPDYFVKSSGGEFSFKVPAKHVYSVGGHWEACQRTTLDDLMTAWADREGEDLTVTEVLDGIYAYSSYVTSFDSYYNAFQEFKRILQYPSQRNDIRINLYQSKLLINDEAKLIEYLSRNLPSMYGKLAKHRAEMHYNGKLVKVIRDGEGTKPGLLKLEFIDSLYQ